MKKNIWKIGTSVYTMLSFIKDCETISIKKTVDLHQKVLFEVNNKYFSKSTIGQYLRIWMIFNIINYKKIGNNYLNISELVEDNVNYKIEISQNYIKSKNIYNYILFNFENINNNIKNILNEHNSLSIDTCKFLNSFDLYYKMKNTKKDLNYEINIYFINELDNNEQVIREYKTQYKMIDIVHFISNEILNRENKNEANR